MDSEKIWLLILGMAVVTYIPRAIPAVFIGKMRFGATMATWLRLRPCSARAALICPGVFTVDAANPAVGILGGAVAGVLAWKKCPVMVCVLAAIAADFALYLVL